MLNRLTEPITHVFLKSAPTERIVGRVVACVKVLVGARGIAFQLLKSWNRAMNWGVRRLRIAAQENEVAASRGSTTV